MWISLSHLRGREVGLPGRPELLLALGPANPLSPLPLSVLSVSLAALLPLRSRLLVPG